MEMNRKVRFLCHSAEHSREGRMRCPLLRGRPIDKGNSEHRQGADERGGGPDRGLGLLLARPEAI